MSKISGILKVKEKYKPQIVSQNVNKVLGQWDPLWQEGNYAFPM